MITFCTHRSGKLNGIFLLFIFSASVAVRAQGKYNGKNIGEFDQYVEKVRKEWNVPGLSITVVRDNQVIFKKGYGVKELGKSEPVDTQTLFACASTTKAMTVALLGMLVDEGKIDWDDKVYKYLPELQFPDPFVSREMTIRDLLIHNSGIGGTDYLTGIMSISANEMFKRIALVRPSYSFRAGFEYQNIMYSAAGRIIERLTGKLWSEVMQERLFKPLGMTLTVPKRKFATTTNITKPHYNVNDTIRVIDYGGDSEIGSAGAVWSNADDMSKWVISMIDSSKYRGGRLLSPATWSEIFKPQNFFPLDEYPTMQLLKPNWMTYGLGWYQHDYKGHKVNFHTGSLSGLTAITGHIPDQKLGVFIFGNYDHAEVRHVLMYKTFDWFALGETRDWNKEFKELYDGIASNGKKRRAEFEANRIVGTSPSSALTAYAGRYQSTLYGEAVVTVEGENLRFEVNKVVKVALPHWHYDTFYGRSKRGTGSSVTATFQLTANGKVNILIFNGMEFKRAGS
jgi:CubicO group peptidase (beta-lactamase class C family)